MDFIRVDIEQIATPRTHPGFMYPGELIEFGPTAQIFTRPKDSRTVDYITGKYGGFNNPGSPLGRSRIIFLNLQKPS